MSKPRSTPRTRKSTPAEASPPVRPLEWRIPDDAMVTFGADANWGVVKGDDFYDITNWNWTGSVQVDPAERRGLRPDEK